MPYRTFVDQQGADWQVWDIVPRLTERRTVSVMDRRVEITPIAFADRRREERRALSQARRGVLRGSFAQGWLCFESDYEKRRLSPIPSDWITCSEDRLEMYSRHGQRVTGAYKAFMADQEGLAEAG